MEIGTVVKLKSGGPPMTVVEKYTKIGIVECRWFSGTIIGNSTFPVKALKTTYVKLYRKEKTV